ncbi:S-Ena type endospore appendage [Bacillus sp. JJ1566]|uniref:S-Ena type endospore appendage n=1 Tax=Bacillus sp. JJ1566 TaxID=3122961 RepID=UPI002FFDFC28
MSKKKKTPQKNNVFRKLEKDSGNITGDLQLNNQVPSLDIWEVYHEKDATVFVSVHNSSASTDSITVRAFRKDGTTLFFNVPPGNTSSGTVDQAELIRVSRINQSTIEGKFSLDVRLSSSKE